MDLSSLRPNWKVDDIAVTGRVIYEGVPNDQQPDWAGAILLYVSGEAFHCDELASIVDLSYDERKWIEAHDAFQAIRKLSLQNEKLNRQDSHQQLVLDIGETAAKVIYNASGGPAPFDHHAGWRMATRVRRLVEFVGQKDFEDCCWHLLIRDRRD